MALNESIKLTLDVDGNKAKVGLKDFAGALRDVESDENDARTAGQKMADGLSSVADQMAAELKQARSAADKLALSLGEDGVQAFKDAGKSVDDLIGELRKAGLSYQEIEADTDALAGSMTKLNNVGRDINTHVTKNWEGVTRETDRSRSVMANYVGNAAQEIPGLAGAFGPLNVAVGQFAEYATEGGISLAGMASTIGPIAGIGASVWYLNNQLDLMQKKDAFHSDRVKTYETLVKKSGDAAKNLADHLREVGKIEATTWGNTANPFADASQDITKAATAAGLSVDQYSKLVTGGTDAIKRWYRAQIDAGNSVDPALMQALADDARDYKDAAEKAAVSARFFGDESAGASRKLDQLTRATESQNKAYDDMTTAMSKEDSFNTAILSMGDLKRALEDIDKQEADGVITHEEAMARRSLAINGVKESTDEYLKSVLNLPPDVSTKINALIDQGEYKQVQDLLTWYAAIEKYKTDAKNSAPVVDRPFLNPSTGMPLPGTTAPNMTVINVQALFPTVEVGRAIRDALRAHERSGGAR